MLKARGNESNGDDFSAVSSATPIISNYGVRKGRNSQTNNQKGEIADDFSAISTTTPTISNISVPRSKSSSGKIDYGQLVIDARSQDPKITTVLENGKQSCTTKSKNSPHSADENDILGSTTSDGKSTSPLHIQPSSQRQPLMNDDSQDNQEQINARVGGAFETIWLPFLVVILTTARFLLSTTSSLGCNFIEIDIGFVPQNIKFTTSKVRIGPWAYDRGKCLSYPHNFSEVFIHHEKSWNAARIASIVNITLGFVVFITASIVITYKVLRLWPTSARGTYCIKGFDKWWEILTFILVILMFIFEVIKFTLWGANLCTDDVWMTDEYSFVLPNECSLSTGARYSLSAILIDIVVVILLSVWSSNLRRSLSHTCCRRDREPVRTEDDDEENPTPRYFFEGNDDDIKDDSKKSEDVGSEIDSTESADVSTFFKKRRKSKVKGSTKDNFKRRKSKIKGSAKDNENEEGSSLLPQNDHSTSLEQTEKKWLHIEGRSEGKAHAHDISIESDSNSGSEDSDEPSSRHSTDIASERESNPFEDDAARDFLGFNEGPLTIQQIGQSSHKPQDSDDLSLIREESTVVIEGTNIGSA
eukprot:scaffold592_cov272-Chaetoceros_neogracile.AAC.29